MKLNKELKKELLEKASKIDLVWMEDEYELFFENNSLEYGRIVINCPECNFWRGEDDDALWSIGICDNCDGQDYCKSCDNKLNDSDWEESPYCPNKNCEEYLK